MSRRKRRPAPPSARRAASPAWLAGAAVALLTALVYLPVLRNGFVSWDDGTAILRNEHLRGIDWQTVRWAFATFHMGHYQPLAWLSLGIDRAVWELDPLGYHLTAVALHAANALLVFLLARRLLAAAGGAPASVRYSAPLAALLFALHPLRVESVAWATERRDLLSAFFFLLAVLAYLRAHDAPDDVRRRRTWMVVAFVASSLAVLAKAIGPMLLGTLVLLDFWPLRRFGAGLHPGREERRRWTVWVEKLPWAALAAASAIVAVHAQQTAGALLEPERYAAGARLVAVVRSLAFYPLKSLLPMGLAPIYEIPHGGLPADARFFVALVVTAGWTVAAVVAGRRMPAFAVAWGLYLVHLLPVSGLFQSGPQWAADRYSYLSCLGFALLAAGAAAAAVGRARSTAGRTAVVAAACVAVLALAVATVRQGAIWRDSLTFWTAAIERRPEASIAYSNRSAEWASRGDWRRAEADLREALRLFRPYSDAWLNLAFVRGQLGDWRESAAAAREALALRPDDPVGLRHLGAAQLHLGDPAQALATFDRLVVISPVDAEARLRRASLLDLVGRRDDAIVEAERAVALAPSSPLARLLLASLLESAGRFDEARREGRRALELEPDSETARALVGRLADRAAAGTPGGR